MERDFKELKSKKIPGGACPPNPVHYKLAPSVFVKEISQYLFVIHAWVMFFLFVVQGENFQN